MSGSSNFSHQLQVSGRYGLWEERDRITSRQETLLRERCDLAFTHYPTFISAAQCCKDINKDFTQVQGQLGSLEEKVPKLLKTCQRFREKTAQVALTRKRTSLVLARHTRLLEVLELPQLMETCARSGHYEEALAIQHLTAKLGKTRANIPLVASVLGAIQVSSTWMLCQLLARLKTQIQLPECLKVVGFIRRMDVFSETELRLKFLQSREVHFASVLNAANADADPYSRLCKIIEQTRMNVFDTITQYRALFSDDDPVIATAGAFTTITYRQIFSSWLFRRVQIFLAAMEDGLRSGKMEDQSLESLLGQVMYFGQSLGRVGFDFRLQLVPLFTDVILSRAMTSLSGGIEALEDSLKDVKTTLPTNPPEAKPKDPDANPLEPPSTIVAYYPLAEICNAVITTLNDCRYCAPVVAAVELPKQIELFLGQATRLLNEQQERLRRAPTVGAGACGEAERRSYDAMLRTYNEDVIPYVQTCCENIFNTKANQAMLLV